jgi:hypothetical protein
MNKLGIGKIFFPGRPNDPLTEEQAAKAEQEGRLLEKKEPIRGTDEFIFTYSRKRE